MSRYVKDHPTKDECLIYGWDHTGVYWWEVHNEDPEHPGSWLLNRESNFFRGASHGEMIELLKEFDCPEEHIDSIASDLPF